MEKFVFVGTKGLHDNTELIDMLDGRTAAHGEEIELSESEVEALKAGGVKLRSVGESDGSDDAEESDAKEASASEGEGDKSSGLFGSR